MCIHNLTMKVEVRALTQKRSDINTEKKQSKQSNLVVIIWRRQSPNKRFTIRKCFVHPLVDYQLQVIFKTLDDPR